MDKNKLSLKDRLINKALALKMYLVQKKLERPFRQLMRRPAKTQSELLKAILEENKYTVFGQEHHFDQISDYASFQKNVPVMGYEYFRGYIEKQDQEKKPYLTAQMPFMFSQTSGTTGKPKYIPVLEEFLTAFQHQQELSASIEYHKCPEAFEGKILGIVGSAVEGHLPSGTPYGSISGYIYKNYPKTIQSKYVVPSEVFEIKDYELRYYIIARLALEQENITVMATATPTTFHKILEVINTHQKKLIREIQSGECKGLNKLKPEIKKVVEKRLSPNPLRAQQLHEMAEKKKDWDFYDFWPNLKMVITWIGSSSGISLKLLLGRLPKRVNVIDLGYISSEFRGTITMEAKTPHGAPTIDQNFFEFVEEKNKEDGRLNFKLIHQLKKGKQYYIFITTRNGLYRYDMNDIVEVSSFVGRTPLFRFVQKGKGVTNISGEKLHEDQLIEAMEGAQEKFKLDVKFYQMLANQTERRYELYVQLKPGETVDANKLADYVDKKLEELNVVYKHKRSDGHHLKAVTVGLLKPGTFEKYKTHLVNKGQRESQFKVLLIQNKEDCDFDFGAECK